MRAPQRLGEPRKLQGLKLLLPRASEDVDLPAFLLHLRGWTGHLAPRACLAPPQGDPGRDPLLTWSCLRAFCACSGFLYSTNPNPMDSSTPERDRVGSRTRAPGGEENKEAGRTKFKGSQGPPGRPLNSLISSRLSWFPERPQPPVCRLLLVVWKNQPTRLQSRHLRPGGLLINR